MTKSDTPDLKNYYEGKGCMCAASNAADCCCENADWTPREVYELKIELNEARQQLAESESDRIAFMEQSKANFKAMIEAQAELARLKGKI